MLCIQFKWKRICDSIKLKQCALCCEFHLKINSIIPFMNLLIVGFHFMKESIDSRRYVIQFFFHFSCAHKFLYHITSVARTQKHLSALTHTTHTHTYSHMFSGFEKVLNGLLPICRQVLHWNIAFSTDSRY